MEEERLWSEYRERLISAAGELGPGGRDAVRLADLLLGQALAGLLGLADDPTPDNLNRQLGELAQLRPPKLSRARARRRAAIEAATACAAHLADGQRFHLWSESSQSRDPSRKGRGAFSTPPELARVLASGGLKDLDPAEGGIPTALDPSAGHGALLLALLDALVDRGAPAREAARGLHGVELDPHARELCCLILWLRIGLPEVTLAEVASRVIQGNALTARWQAEGAGSPSGGTGSRPGGAFTWETAFPAAFAGGGFDLVLANPPWESLRAIDSPAADEWQQRAQTRERLCAERADGRGLPPLYSAQGRGDRNLYKGFAELFPHLLSPAGRLVALLPGAFSSDLGMQSIRRFYLDHMDLERWTSFENLAGYFPIDSRYKFGILVAARSETGTSSIQVRFMAREGEEATRRNGHLELSRSQVTKIGGSSTMIPEVSDRHELAILERAAERGSGFFDPEGSFGVVRYRRELDLTLDRKAGKFVHVEEAEGDGFRPLPDGAWSDGSRTLVPLIEGRMVSAWEFFEKSWVSGNGRSARWRVNDGPLSVCRPQFLAPAPRTDECRLAICDVTSATNTRTMRASWVPSWPCGNTAPVLTAGGDTQGLALLAVLNSMTFDWLLRRLAAGLHLNRFYLEAMPLPRLSGSQPVDLAGFAARRVLAGQRCKGLDRRQRAPLRRLAAAGSPLTPGEVEAAVAAGYGLSASLLRRVMDESTEDRKGLWRFFAANPEAIGVANEGIEVLAAA